MKPTTSLITALVTYPILVKAATITLFAVQPPDVPTGLPTPSETYSVGGVGPDGATTYAHDVAISVVVQWMNGGSVYTSDGQTLTAGPRTTTVTQPPVTHHGTLVADASHYVYSAAGAPESMQNVVVSCDLDGRGGGACVQRAWTAGGATATMSYTGPAVPVRTLISPDGGAGGGGGGATNGGVTIRPRFEVLVAGGVVSFGVLCGFFVGL